MIRVGTSSFRYKDWVGPYYPPELGERDWLAFYAREFLTCELNFTYYRLPMPKHAPGWPTRRRRAFYLRSRHSSV
jgi:uncharacterized protein YecE (DUF72 family)